MSPPRVCVHVGKNPTTALQHAAKAISVADIMRTGNLLGGVLIAVGLALPSTALADQAQDWVLSESRPEGASAVLDLFVGGGQAAIEHRTNIYGGANTLTLRGSSIVAVPFASAQADVELRILNVVLGVTAGGVDYWRQMAFGEDEAFHRKQRRFRAASADFERNQRAFYEARGLIAFPFNEYMLGVTGIRYRLDGFDDRTFDGSNVRDDGLFEWNTMLFFKHKFFGAIAPTITRQIFERGGQDVDQYAFGLTFLTRASLVRHNDMIVVQTNFHNSSWTGGDNSEDSFGNEMFRGPMTFLIAYRTVIDFWDPNLDDDDDDLMVVDDSDAGSADEDEDEDLGL